MRRRDSYFTIFEIKVGMAADVGTFPRIVKLLPEGVARELAYTGRKLSADESDAAGVLSIASMIRRTRCSRA